MEKKLSTEVGGKTLTIETGKVAKQADGSAMVWLGETVVLVTAVSSDKTRPGIDFFPLTVNYQEMTYAAGRIPGGFFKREGRPSDRETLASRFIDRTIRPLFPKGFKNETQIIATVLSADQENDPAVMAIVGASAALVISDIPFLGPIGGVRVGRVDGSLICNPTTSELERSDIDLIIAGNREGITMVEGGGSQVREEEMLEALLFGYESLAPTLEIQDRLASLVGRPKREVPQVDDREWVEKVKSYAAGALQEAYRIRGKLERQSRLNEVVERTVEELAGEDEEARERVLDAVKTVERSLVREAMLRTNRRIDGRGFSDIRPISCEVGILPRTHGSGLFTRGETQVLAVTTFGTAADEQKIESITGESYKTFMLHYNFPPFCVGETAMLRAPSRREIGHGALAERAILPVLPSDEEFPYTIRMVSEVLESNGSSSMATVCGGSLSLMDAGVPIKAAVAGIAMGLVKEGDRVEILSDILGDEDHLGDMDFKVAGTERGVTALQMDIKVPGISREILERALGQAREGRLYILEKMNETIAEPRAEISVYAPRITTIHIKPEKIRDVIGPGGKNIRAIIEETGVKIDVEDSGMVTIASPDKEAVEEAIAMVKKLTQEVEVGALYLGKVKRVLDFGAIVEIFPGVDGLVHISQIANERIRAVSDVLKEGDEVLVKVLEVEHNGRIRLSRKAALREPRPASNQGAQTKA
ncbi:MAG: polyribonucleotide nucleotidyltransferase [Deltaproteobacteria bacterium]|nr:polyribonucleotide nucleotidyltransferase [Deltaproteobacteria bacterium]